jgi:DNA-binding SARP family transcriptional activator
VYTLGGFRVLVDGETVDDHAWRRKTARQLFKVLLTRPGRRMTRDEVVELFWPDSDADAASSNLRSALYAMRRALGGHSVSSPPEVVFGDHTSVWLGADTELWTDASVFEQLVAEAWRSPNPLPRLEEASALYAGDYLPDDLYEDWAIERREVLRRTWTELQFGLAQALEAQSADLNAVLQPLERLTRLDPTNERAVQEQIKLLARYGRRAEALRVYERLVQSLREELEVQPSTETAELYRHISRGEPVAPPPIPAAAFRCAYPFPIPSELVGRDEELAALDRVVSAGRTAGRVALIAAPAGTGKSALVGHLVRQTQAHGVLCLAGGSYEERAAVPLGPFHDALLDFVMAQPPARARELVGATADDLALVIPELRYHLELAADTSWRTASFDRSHTFGAIHACLRNLAERGPVLVCLEDLHAADEATLQLLHYLARQTRRLPLVLIATYRSDEAPPDQPLAQTVSAMVRERLADRVNLNPLDRARTDQLVSLLLDGSPSEALSESLFATTGGNPLFVEQLVLALGEAGQLQEQAGVWHGDTNLQGTPQIVREVIAQRLQRLDPSCREMLAVASVLGQTFEHRILLAAAQPPSEATLLRDLDRAIAAQVLRDTAPQGYAFRHALLREAVYWDLSAPRRMELHAAMGDVLELAYQSGVQDHAAELAHHFSLGGASSHLRSKTIHYSLLAGQRAEALSAHREALVHFSLACDLLSNASAADESAIALDALEGRGRAERQLAMWSEAVATFRHVLDRSETASRRGRARAVLVSALLYSDPARALEEIERGLTDLTDSDGNGNVGPVRIHLQSLMALVWFLNGHYEKLLRLGQEMRETAAHLDPLSRSRAFSVAAWAHLGRGQMPQAQAQYELALAEAERSGNKVQIAAVHDNLGALQCLSGKFDSARGHIELAVGMYHELTGDLPSVYALSNLARVWLGEGDLQRAEAQAEAAFALASENAMRWVAECQAVLGAVSALRANWEAASASFERAAAIQQEVGNIAANVESLLGLGRACEHAGDLTRARTVYADALEIASTTDVGPHVVAALRHIGRLDLKMQHASEARVRIAHALLLAEDERMQETLEWSPTLVAAGELEVQTGGLVRGIELITRGYEAARTREHQIEAGIALALALAELSEGQAAHGHAVNALELADRLEAPRLQGLAHRAVARAAVAQSDQTLATTAYRAALDLLERARALEDLALVLQEFKAVEG